MTIYEDDQTKVEVLGQAVTIVPQIPKGGASENFLESRSSELQALFPIADGWRHFKYGVNQTSASAEGRMLIARMAKERIESVGSKTP